MCPLCHSDQARLVTNELRFDNKADVLQCLGCSLVYIDQNSFQFPDNFYETHYHQTYLTHIDPDILDPEKHFQKMTQASQLWINKVKDTLKGTEKVLDVGCSTGHFLMGIKDYAGQVFGHELSEKEVEFCRKNLGLDVENRDLEERFDLQSFDLITMIFVLEHIGDPIPFLTNLKKLLKPDGKLIIVVPNILDPLVNFYDIEQFKKFYFCIEHLFYYSPETLKQVLQKAGFKSNPINLQEYPISNHLNWIYTRGPRETLAARLNSPQVDLLNPQLEDAFDDFWTKTNKHYKEMLENNGYGDRIFCMAEIENDFKE